MHQPSPRNSIFPSRMNEWQRNGSPPNSPVTKRDGDRVGDSSFPFQDQPRDPSTIARCEMPHPGQWIQRFPLSVKCAAFIPHPSPRASASAMRQECGASVRDQFGASPLASASSMWRWCEPSPYRSSSRWNMAAGLEELFI
jgi:hypothetical protein